MTFTRPLLLTGFMATGKSTVGRLVAERAGLPFVDLDERIAARAGMSISQLFAESGEEAFRRLERVELEACLHDARPRVVALGGGALLHRETRLRALEASVVVCLRAPVAEILRRASEQGGRPLLGVDDPAARVEQLLDARSTSYAEAHATIDSEREPASVAERVLQIWAGDPIAVAAGTSSYAVEIGPGLLSQRLPELIGPASLALLVTDENVARHHGERMRAAVAAGGRRSAEEVLEPGEQHKTISTVERIWRRALAAGADRKSLLIGVGGGVVTDLTGFAAATWMRGVRWIGVPSTLLSQVDASVGGKTGCDLELAKNAVGAFWQPSAVLCDVALLATEPQRGFVSALAEVVKTALIGDAELLRLLEASPAKVLERDPALTTELVRRSVRVKAAVVSRDERESGLRARLNLGHTVGHALESLGGYTELSHGEAVSLGLVAALRIGERLGQTPPELTGRVVALLGTLGLPVALDPSRLDRAGEIIGHDKKRAGQSLRFVVARGVGRVDTVDLGLAELKDHIGALARLP